MGLDRGVPRLDREGGFWSSVFMEAGGNCRGRL